MKKTLTLLCTIFWCIQGNYAQTCGTAQSLSGYTNGSALSQTSREKWYSFNALYQNMTVDVLKTDTTIKQVDSVMVYGNTCTSPVLLRSYGRPPASDSLTGAELRMDNLTAGLTYFIKVKLKSTPLYTINYTMYFNQANASTLCDMVTNGDFENTNGNPCPVAGVCWPGTYLIPFWATGSHQSVYMHSLNSSCLPNFTGIPHSGTFCGAVDAGQPTPPPTILDPVFSYDNHSYLRVSFTPLTASRKYYVQMFYRKEPQRKHAGDGLGMFLSVNAPNITPPPPNWSCGTHILPTITPQIDNPAGNFMTNTNWLPMSGVFTSPGGGENYLTIGNFKWGGSGSTSYTTVTAPGANLVGCQYQIDDVSITPIDINMTSVSICSGMGAALNPQVCTPPYCTSTFTWAPAAGLSSTGTSSTIASPTITTTYTLTQTITNAIGAVFINTAAVTITVTPRTFSFAPTSNVASICTNLGQSAVTLSCVSNAAPNVNYVWFPGSLAGAFQFQTPTVTTTYTVFASMGACTYSDMITVAVSSVCCTNTVNVVTTATLNGVILNGPAVINQDMVIGGGLISKLQAGEFQIAPNVKITVLGGSQLELRGAHLYACGNMWKGIEVNANGRVASAPTGTNTTLVEDAITAISITNVNSVPTLSLVEIKGAVFNKNYVTLSMTNCTANALPIFFEANVITSRSLTFTPTQWPNAGITASHLRTAVNPTTGLLAPYTLQGFANSNLKAPYAGQPGHIGVRCVDVGNPTGLPSYGVSLGQSTTLNGYDNFNLFDGIGYGIYAVNANVNSNNNVFQNMLRYQVGGVTYGGDAISHSCNSLMNTKLNLTDPIVTNTSSGNRFWNCYRAINGSNLYQLNVEYAIFRSRQSNLGVGFLPGNTGIYISSSRFQYYIRNNNFNNIKNCITMAFYAGSNDMGSGPQPGIYAGNLHIGNNYFGAQTSSTLAIVNEFVDNAISISSPNNTGWQAMANTSLKIWSNNLNRVYHGISVNGMNGYETSISTNSVVMNDDVNNTTQRGIELVNTLTRVTVLTNTLSGSGLTNTLTSLVYCGSNAGSGSPSVCCNNLDFAYKGFEFNSSNPATVWKGNAMNNLGKGMVLSSAGVIGPQGGPGAPIDNQWTNFAGGSNGTWTESGSNVANSKLTIRNTIGSPWTPPNNNGNPTNLSYATPSNFLFTTGSYTCASPLAPPPAYVMVIPGNGGDESEDMAYSSASSTYRFLDENPAQMDSSVALANFYDSLSSASIGQFKQVEEQLYAGQLNTAKIKNNSVLAGNNAEYNYKQYYQLYDRYARGIFSVSDSSSLFTLASLCPGSDGPCVYQARSLYTLLYKTVLNVTDNCDQVLQGSRRFNTNMAKNRNTWSIEVYPNPGNGQFQLLNRFEKDELEITVKDISGRQLLQKTIAIHNYTGSLNLDLNDGVYLITLKNSLHESVTKKLVIAR